MVERRKQPGSNADSPLSPPSQAHFRRDTTRVTFRLKRKTLERKNGGLAGSHNAVIHADSWHCRYQQCWPNLHEL